MYKASACKKFVLKNPILKDKKLVTDLVPCQLGDFKFEVGRRRQTAAEKYDLVVSFVGCPARSVSLRDKHDRLILQTIPLVCVFGLQNFFLCDYR